MRVLVLDGLASLADAVAALPAAGRLPARTVLVPSERHAHALRRALLRSGRGGALAGTRLVGPLTAAVEVLRAAGSRFTWGEEAIRPARILAVLRDGLPLERFGRELLHATRGWEEAFASAIADLEEAGLSPADLPREDPQARDLAAVWARAAAAAGASWSAARIYMEAAEILARDPGAWPLDGAALAMASGHEAAALARFLAAIPDVALALEAARPAGERLLERVGRLYGTEARSALERAGTGRAPTCAAPGGAPAERDLLAAYLLADSRVLAAPDRPRSRGPDGTVDLEEHAGIEAELEATATWVARQVLEARRPLEEIAVLVPSLDPLGQLVAERLERLPLEGGPLPVHVAGGLPASATAAGARILAVLRALASSLSAETLAPVLAALRLEARPPPQEATAGAEAEAATAARARNHLTHGEATEIAWGLGTVGGNAAHPEGALEWSARAAARIAELESAVLHARADEDSAAREAFRLERTLENLRAVRPALDALVGVARAVVEGAPLPAIRDALLAFLGGWLLAPGEGASLPARLAESLAGACAGPLGDGLSGEDALEIVRRHLLSLRVPRGRFGDPAVYVGTIQGAAGLEFAAVRVVGLCEGVVPSAPVEDPVLPEGLRRALEDAEAGAASPRVLPLARDRASAQVRALLAAIRGAREAVALSAPRVDLARTEREPASLFVDAAAALARPDARSGARGDAVPGMRALRRDYFRPAGAAADAFRDARPVSDASWLDRAARGAVDLPPAWSRDPVLALGRVDALRALSGKLGPADGVLGPGEPFPPVPGLSRDRPISATALREFLECPRMFLMKRILRWEEPATAPPLRELDARSYGLVLHHAIEAFYRRHGADFVRGRGSIAEWLALGRELADRELDAFLSAYPLVGEGIRAKERDRLRESVRSFLEYDFAGRGRRYVGVELPFGEPVPLAVEAGGVTLHVHGFIDRVDVEGDATLVRDLKSGRAYRRTGDEAGPTAARDVQLGLYQLAARELAVEWRTPRKVKAAYVYASGRAEVEERAFRSDADADALARATGEWLSTAARLLATRSFPPSADEDDCPYCPFRPLCGDEAVRRAREGLAEEEDGALAAFRVLKLGGEDEA